jgi:hypothetical protein
LRLAVGAPGKSRALDGNGEGEFLAALTNGVMLSECETKSLGNNFVDFFQDGENPLLGLLQVTREASNLGGNGGAAC